MSAKARDVVRMSAGARDVVRMSATAHGTETPTKATAGSKE